MTNTIHILALILVLTSGAWTLLRAYRTDSRLLAFLGLSLVALGFGLGAMRVNDRTAAWVFVTIAIAANLAGRFWRTPTVPTGESRR